MKTSMSWIPSSKSEQWSCHVAASKNVYFWIDILLRVWCVMNLWKKEFMIQYVGSFNQLDFFMVLFLSHLWKKYNDWTCWGSSSIYFWRNYKQGAGLPVRNFRFHGFSEAFACACRVATGIILKKQMLDLLHLFLKKEFEIIPNGEDPSSTFNWVLKLRGIFNIQKESDLKENPSDTTQGRSIGGKHSPLTVAKQFVKRLRWIHIDSW